MRAFYRAWPNTKILQTLSGESINSIDLNDIEGDSSTVLALASRFRLPWSAYVRLLSVNGAESLRRSASFKGNLIRSIQARHAAAGILRLAQLPPRICPSKCLVLRHTRSCRYVAHKQKILGRRICAKGAEMFSCVSRMNWPDRHATL
jgi:hypothetical protein